MAAAWCWEVSERPAGNDPHIRPVDLDKEFIFIL